MKIRVKMKRRPIQTGPGLSYKQAVANAILSLDSEQLAELIATLIDSDAAGLYGDIESIAAGVFNASFASAFADAVTGGAIDSKVNEIITSRFTVVPVDTCDGTINVVTDP